MKSLLKSLVIILDVAILTVAPAYTRAADDGSQAGPTFEVPRQISLHFELQDSADPATADSWWELSFKLHVADQSDFLRWLAQRKDGRTDIPAPGVLLKEGSHMAHNLALEATRNVQIMIPVRGELLERFRHVKRNPQVVWLSSSVHVYLGKHAGKLAPDVINNDVSPTWDLRYFINKIANVKLTVTPNGRLTWSSATGNQQMHMPKGSP